MGNTVIRIEHLSKQYRLGLVSTKTVSHDLNRWWHRIRGKSDPYERITGTNDRTTSQGSNYVWSLKDVSFDVQQGDVLGIIGKNGAGKSTLLKILSKVTAPTKGSISIRGRVASLLEVGTGFHPELSGRDNIFLNGAILGMSKSEIRKKFDEIVDFSGVEKYIETPVKRYSSGMYVRLAFAVAAHLESEILVVDEVLAVGDAEFQKKCMGKMEQASKGEGRTVLFVSHNMTAVNSLCNKAVYLNNGMLHSMGNTRAILDEYMRTEYKKKTHTEYTGDERPGDSIAKLHSARIINASGHSLNYSDIHSEMGIEIKYEVLKDGYCPVPNIHLHTATNVCVFVSAAPTRSDLKKQGVHNTIVWIPANFLNQGTYVVKVALTTMQPMLVHCSLKEALIFEVIEDLSARESEYLQHLPGIIRPTLQWTCNQN